MDNLHRQAEDLIFRLKDYLEQPNSPLGASLHNEFQKLEDDIQEGKSKESVEHRVNEVINILNGTDGTGVMTDMHVNDLKTRCSYMRDQLRKM